MHKMINSAQYIFCKVYLKKDLKKYWLYNYYMVYYYLSLRKGKETKNKNKKVLTKICKDGKLKQVERHKMNFEN